jgi:hypothetical protein
MTVILGPRRETVRAFTTLGIRFWDAALERQVSGALDVLAFRRDTRELPVRAHLTPSGVYAFHDLPGLREVEHPLDNVSVLGSPPAAVEFLIAVRDSLGRYLPMTFGVALPLPYRGLFPAGDSVPLFSAPTRAIPPGLGAVRAELWDTNAELPGSHAVLRVKLGADVWTGIADDTGRVLVVLPTPTVERLTLGSPPGSGQGSPDAATWPIAVSVSSTPGALRFPLGIGRPGAAAFARVPSLKTVLEDQTAGQLFAADNAAPTSSLDATLPFGRELVLRTRRTSTTEDSGRLWIAAGASPP